MLSSQQKGRHQLANSHKRMSHSLLCVRHLKAME